MSSLVEDLAQVVLDGSRADEQSSADLRVRVPVAGELGDLRLLSGELGAGLGRAFADGLTGGPQLAPGALGECLESHLGEQVVSGAELLACVQSTAVAAQPLAVDEVGAGELGADAGTAEPLDRLSVVPLGGLALAQQGTRAGRDPERPVGAGAGASRLSRVERGAASSGRPLRAAASTSSGSAPPRTTPASSSSHAPLGAAIGASLAAQAVVEHGGGVAGQSPPQLPSPRAATLLDPAR